MRVASTAMGLSMWIGTLRRRPASISSRRIRVICWARPTAKAGMSTMSLAFEAAREGADDLLSEGLVLVQAVAVGRLDHEHVVSREGATDPSAGACRSVRRLR